MSFTVLGVVAGFRSLWRAGRRAMQEDAEADAADAQRKSVDEDDGSGTAGTR